MSENKRFNHGLPFPSYFSTQYVKYRNSIDVNFYIIYIWSNNHCSDNMAEPAEPDCRVACTYQGRGGGVVVLRALVSETLAIQIIVPRDRMKYDVWQSHRFHLLFVYSFLFVGCAVTFRNMSELQRHIRVHTGKIVFNTRQVWTQHYPIRNAHSIDWTAPSTLNFNFLFAVFLFRSLKPEFIASFYLHGNIYTVRFVYFLHCQFT